MNRISRSGGLLGFQAKKRLSQLSSLETQREYLRLTIEKPIRGRRARKIEFGIDPDEQRAVQSVEGSILERIVYKKLLQLIGPEGVSWEFKHGIRGARVFKGGYELDFVIYRPRQTALEVQGAYWHGPVQQYRDVARALAVLSDGFEYAEILEWEIELGDQFLEFRLRQLLGL